MGKGAGGGGFAVELDYPRNFSPLRQSYRLDYFCFEIFRDKGWIRSDCANHPGQQLSGRACKSGQGASRQVCAGSQPVGYQRQFAPSAWRQRWSDLSTLELQKRPSWSSFDDHVAPFGPQNFLQGDRFSPGEGIYGPFRA